MIRYAISLGLVFIISLIMSYLEYGLTLTLLVSFLIISFGIFLPYYHTIFQQKNVTKIEKFLIRNKKQPIYQFYYAIANELDDEIEASLEKVLKKQKLAPKRAIIEVIYHLYKKDRRSAKEKIELIENPLLKKYYEASIQIDERRYRVAEPMINELTQDWMKDALYSEIALKKQNRKQAIKHAKAAYENAKGLQKYMLYKSYTRDFPELTL
ncbi:hypothetical protein [Bacillus solimangrovi]|uniref:Uncharacterized protein n=1 Tax=Bacillus solimangrovi TaxID=1305675 RepID=A0A1E5LJI9_9BACI|nr:hypothetical protein [Bacillus solimangrovi]OEH94231.1 hypothetical protein BFG57_09280 [Bacillus solimangrovi]